MRFDLIDLRLFLHVAETGSITHGAARANLALASASARIRGMEETLGVDLLERGRRGVRPTPAGEALVHHARVVLQQLERMKGELGDYARGLKGHVRVLSNTAAMTEFLPDALATYLADHPNIDIDLEERPSYEIVQAVAQGLADLGIVADGLDLGALETFPFRLDRLVAVVPRGHRAGQAPAARLPRYRRARLRRPQRRQRAAGPSRRACGPRRARTQAARPRARLRCGVPHGGARRRPGNRAGDGRAAVPAHDGDRHGAPLRPLGPAAAHRSACAASTHSRCTRSGWCEHLATQQASGAN